MNNLLKTIIIVIVLMLIQTGQASSQIDNERILQLTREISSTDDFDIALKKSNELIKLAPDSGSSYATRGIVYFKANKFKESIKDVNNALLLGIDDKLVPIIRNLRGLSHFKLENYELAISDFTYGIENLEKDHKVYLLRSIAYRNIGKIDLAVKDEQMANKLKRIADNSEKTDDVNEDVDDDFKKLINETSAFFEKSDYENSIKGFTKIIDIVGEDENVYAIYLSRGRSYFELNKLEAAMSDYNMTIKLQPDMSDAYIYRGEVYSRTSKYDLALEDFNKALKLKPNDVLALLRRGEVYLAQDRYKKAISDFDSVLKLDAEFYSGWFFRAQSHFGNKDYKSALRDISQFIKLQENVADAFEFRAKVLSKLGRNIEAERDQRKFEQLSKENN